MKFKLSELGLSKDIEKYWKKIDYNLSPENWINLIVNFTKIPVYKKVSYIEDFLENHYLNKEYTEYCRNYWSDYYENVSSFKSITADMIYGLNVSKSEFNIDYVSKSYTTLQNLAHIDGIEDTYIIYKLILVKEANDDAKLIDSYIIYDENDNIVDYYFGNRIREMPYHNIDFPTDFTSNDIFKLSYDNDYNMLLMGLNYRENDELKNTQTFSIESEFDNGAANIMYFDQYENAFYYDHSNPIFFERVTNEELGEYPNYIKELVIKYRNNITDLIQAIHDYHNTR